MSCALAGSSNSRVFKPVGVSDAFIKDEKGIPAQKPDNLVGELILVDMNREYKGFSRVVDTKT